MWMSHAAYEWIMSQMYESCQVWMSQSTLAWRTVCLKSMYIRVLGIFWVSAEIQSTVSGLTVPRSDDLS